MEKIIIAEIIKPQGIRGEIKVKPIISDRTKLLDINKVYLSDEKKSRAVKGVRLSGVYAYFYIEGVISRNDAELLRNQILSIDENDLKIDGNTFLINDIIGCQVFDDTGKDIGRVVEILQHGAADIYVVDIGAKTTMMFPFIADVLVSVDTKLKKIILNSDRLKEIAIYE